MHFRSPLLETGAMDYRNVKTTQLSKVAEGQRARITAVGGSGALRRRILEMGMTKGTELLVEKYAPLRDPLEIIVKGFHISLRVEEASEIMVEIVE
jgi:Fe2+ transport system protein FeoA